MRKKLKINLSYVSGNVSTFVEKYVQLGLGIWKCFRLNKNELIALFIWKSKNMSKWYGFNQYDSLFYFNANKYVQLSNAH